MGVRETEPVLQIKVTLSIEVESGLLCLIDASVDGDQYGLGTDLAGREVSLKTSSDPLLMCSGWWTYAKNMSRSLCKNA